MALLLADIGSVVSTERLIDGTAFAPGGDIVIISVGSFFASEDPAFGGESGIVAYNTTSGAELARLANIDVDSLGALAFSSDGGSFVVGGRSGVLVLYDYERFVENPTGAEVGRATMGGAQAVLGAASAMTA
jgi:hypothetical protein